MNKNLSKLICKECNINPQIITDHELNEIEVYPDFNEPKNYKKLIETIIKSKHWISLSNNFCEIGNGDTDFVLDCHNEYFSIHGKDLLSCLYNYLRLWIEQGTLDDLGWRDTSHVLTEEECCYPRGYKQVQKDIEKLKKNIQKAFKEK